MAEAPRGHVPLLALGRYRTLKRAERGALDAAMALGQLGGVSTADDCRRAARMLHNAAHELRVVIESNGGSV